MNIASRGLQFAGIVVVGMGLAFGVANNDMTTEILLAAVGLLLFVVGRAVRSSS